MSRHGTLLPIPDDPRFPELLADWQRIYMPAGVHRSLWLTEIERLLLQHYPESRSADRKLTARHYAPFPLALGPNVP